MRRPDLIAAFKMPEASASRVLQAALDHYPQYLARHGRVVRPQLGVDAPAFADETDLMKTLDASGNDYRLTGVSEEELQVTRVTWASPLPGKPGLMLPLVQAAIRGRPVRLKYVGLALGENARWRFVLPLGLERMGDQWRLIATDLEAEGYPSKVFVLARILDLIDKGEKRPRGVVWGRADDKLVPVEVRLNPRLTPAQRLVVSHEMGLSAGVARIPSRSLFEYRRRFTTEAPNPTAVWPLAQDVDVKKKGGC